MRQSLFHRVAPLAAALAFLAPAVQARPHPGPPATQRPFHAGAQVQVDGIVGGVVDQLWQQTDVYWHEGDFPRIVALDRIITEADPQFVEAYSTGGWLMESLGRTKDAEAFYTLGTVHNPRVAYAYWNLGFFYFNTLHDYPAAVRVLQIGTRQPGADLNDWKMLAHSQEKADRWDDAVGTWYAIKARWPDGVSVDRLLAEAVEKRRQLQADVKPDVKTQPVTDGDPRP